MIVQGLILLLATSAYCGSDFSTKIIGGREVEIRDYPYQASIQTVGIHRCGGSIVSKNFILTSADCLRTYDNNPKYMNVRVASKYTEKQGQVRYVKRLISHPKFDRKTLDFDIGLLELAEPLEFGPEVQPIKIATSENNDGKMAEVSGWGWTVAGGDPSDVLLAASIPKLERKTCDDMYPDEITINMFCAGSFGEEGGPCLGDNGGPLVIDGELVGIVSWGIGCRRPYPPGVYTNVARFQDFINKNIY